MSIPLMPLSRGLSMMVDDIDFEIVSSFNWSANIQENGGKVYAFRRYRDPDGRRIYQYVQRFIAERALENNPQALEFLSKNYVHHKDGNSLNQCRDNLEVVTPRYNSARQIQLRKARHSKYHGVSLYVGQNLKKPWLARFGQQYINCFATELEAAQARDEWVLKNISLDAIVAGEVLLNFGLPVLCLLQPTKYELPAAA